MQTTHNLVLKDIPAAAPACIATHRLARSRPRPARMAQPRISDMDLEAYVDGQADATLAQEIEMALRSDSSLRQRKRDLQDQKRLLQLWWKQFS